MKKAVTNPGIIAANEAIELSRILGEFEEILRVTKLPGGSNESDSHHSFSLALICFDIAKKYLPELDAEKIVMYALVHDLLELVKGDENTLFADDNTHANKLAREKVAIEHLNFKLKAYPHILQLLHDYETKIDKEAAVVYWVDKTANIWTHFPDNGKNLKELGMSSKRDIDIWYESVCRKLSKNCQRDVPVIIKDIMHESFLRMRNELISD